MGITQEGEYPRCKYEDPRASRIVKQILYNGQKRFSWQHPWSYNNRADEIKDYIKQRCESSENWGVKVPDLTLCYQSWKMYLPPHKTIGIKRTLEGLYRHYNRHHFKVSPAELTSIVAKYNEQLKKNKVPTITFEDLLTEGPGAIEDVLNIKNLPDFRRQKK
jgi:hypothetical protein